MLLARNDVFFSSMRLERKCIGRGRERKISVAMFDAFSGVLWYQGKKNHSRVVMDS